MLEKDKTHSNQASFGAKMLHLDDHYKSKSKSSIILLTGASGFIGKSILKHAISLGLRVRVLARQPNDWPSNAGFEVVEGDFSVQSDWTRVLEGVQVVVHLAAELADTELMPVVMCLGQKATESRCKCGSETLGSVICVGSYGPIMSGLVSEDQPDKPSDAYELSKSDFDKILKKMARYHDIEVCIVRPSNVYGSGMSNQSIQEMLTHSKKPFAFIGPPVPLLTTCMFRM